MISIFFVIKAIAFELVGGADCATNPVIWGGCCGDVNVVIVARLVLLLCGDLVTSPVPDVRNEYGAVTVGEPSALTPAMFCTAEDADAPTVVCRRATP